MGMLTLVAGLSVVATLACFVTFTPKLALPLLGFFVIIVWEIPALPPIAGVGSISVYPEDVLMLLLLPATVVRAGRASEALGRKPLLWAPLASVAIASLVRGAATVAPAAAVNEFRATAYTFVLTGFILAHLHQRGFRQSFDLFLLVLGWSLVALATYHVTLYGFGAPDEYLSLTNDTVQTTRPLVAGQAAALGLIGLQRFVDQRYISAGVFLAVAVVAQHRTVWVALAVTLATLVLLASPVLRRRLIPALVVTTMLVFIAWSAGLLGDVGNQARASATNLGTFDGRIYAYRQLFARQNASGWVAVLIGQPFGLGFARVNASGQIETFAPHNWYLLLYLRLGLIGSLALVVIVLRSARAALGLKDNLRLAWTIFIAVFCLAYNLSWYLAPFLAVAISGIGLTTSSHLTEIKGRHRGPTLRKVRT